VLSRTTKGRGAEPAQRGRPERKGIVQKRCSTFDPRVRKKEKINMGAEQTLRSRGKQVGFKCRHQRTGLRGCERGKPKKK